VEGGGNDGNTGKSLIAVDPEYFRPTEVETLLGDPVRAREQLGWEPKTDFEELVREMVSEGIKTAERNSLCEREGYRTFNYHE